MLEPARLPPSNPNCGAYTMPHQLPDLPYPENALEPHLSAETLALHHGKHHATYVSKLNGLIEGTDLAEASLVEIVKRGQGGVFNNGAQAWNHAFYWHCMSPSGGGDPQGELAAAVARDFGGISKLREDFSNALTTLFGSGWVWLVKDETDQLSIVSAGNADNPLREGRTPILTCDMWEHAYYVDYRNEKKKYVDAFWAVVDWDFAARNLARPEPFDLT
jgi:Fe-Mn family superoxide dismutase